VLGYDRSVVIAEQALDTGDSVYDLVSRTGWLSRQALDDLLRPETMTRPRRGRGARPAPAVPSR
jgi:aspartate ammonia-lyase